VIDYLIFGVMFVVALGSALAMLFAKNAVHAALFLVSVQLSLALAFLLQGAFFVAAIQVIVYAGAIMVLFLFVIMLLGVDNREVMIEPLPAQRPLALGFGALLAAQILYIVSRAVDVIGDNPAALQALNEDPGNVRALGRLLFTEYVLQFEATAVLLTVAVLGGMVLTRRVAEATKPAQPADIPREERPA
jgi:NADH-quinone oxidoreductase subunit J